MTSTTNSPPPAPPARSSSRPHLELESQQSEDSPLMSESSSRKSYERDGMLRPKGPSYHKRETSPWILVISLSTILVIGVLASIRVGEKREYERNIRLHHRKDKIHVAFIGNSMMYYNDLPRLLERFSENRMEQRSCLHGGTTLTKILVNGNGMFKKFNTTNAFVETTRDHNVPMYDFGDCTVPQLLFGFDEQLDKQVHDKSGYLEDDGSNPCLQEGRYFDWLNGQHLAWHDDKVPPHWDFIFLNDNTRNPARNHTRQEGLNVLNTTYVPWFRRLQATPVFLATHAYWAPQIALTGMAASEEDMDKFTSLTYEGYRQYAALLSSQLPASQRTRIAPVGIAFLTVWEENRDLWHKLYHSDHLHASPLGSFLTGCIVHHTLFGKLPRRQTVLIPNLPDLWNRARVMQQADEPPNPFPNNEEAEYLYGIARRVAVEGYRPKSFVSYAKEEDFMEFDEAKIQTTAGGDGKNSNALSAKQAELASEGGIVTGIKMGDVDKVEMTKAEKESSP